MTWPRDDGWIPVRGGSKTIKRCLFGAPGVDFHVETPPHYRLGPTWPIEGSALGGPEIKTINYQVFRTHFLFLYRWIYSERDHSISWQLFFFFYNPRTEIWLIVCFTRGVLGTRFYSFQSFLLPLSKSMYKRRGNLISELNMKIIQGIDTAGDVWKYCIGLVMGVTDWKKD